MSKNLYSDTLTALSFLTRWHVDGADMARPLASAVRGFAPAGFVIGFTGGLACVAALTLGLPAYLSATIAVAVTIYFTGALHEDGLADTLDGFGGGWQRDDKLRIMRDSHIGTYGVLGLVIAVVARIGGYFAVVSTADGAFEILLVFGALGGLSRSFFGSMMDALDLARQDGRAAEAGKPAPGAARSALIIGLASSFAFLWFAIGLLSALVVIAAAAVAYFAVKRASQRHLGGYTGDVIGLLQQSVEILCLLSLAATN